MTDTPPTLTPDEVQSFADVAARLASNVASVVLGKPEVVRLALTGLFAEGHLLLEDVPGVGKTTLARAIAASVRGQWRRIQFTPDLLPSDVAGVTIFNQANRQFEFHGGPVFANIVVADEINRASPKTQSALLEVMEERQVTVDGHRHGVPRPFLVVATQNPVEMDGTYRLPEAQLDRFLMRLSVGYPDLDAEVRVVMNDSQGLRPDRLSQVIDLPTLNSVIDAVRTTKVQPQIATYAATLAAETRKHSATRYGASPRGSIGLIRAARALAATESRLFVTPDDVKTVAQAVLAHRIVLTPDAELNRITSAQVVREVLDGVPAPGLGSGTLPPMPGPRTGPAPGPYNDAATRISHP